MNDETQDTLFPIEEYDGIKNKRIASTVPMSQIHEVFDYWLETMRTSNRGVKPRLDGPRKNKIAQAINHYGVEVCKKAIFGCSLSEWHMGNNPRGKVYDEITLILRNSDQIEKFANLADNHKTGWEHE